MGLKVGEFFVELGIAGAVKTKEAIGSVRSMMKGTRDASFEMKAGIFGAVVALEEITRRSIGAAVDLKNFAGATGLSTDALQKLNYWAEMNDVSAEGMTQTIKGLQAAQSALRLGMGVPAGAVYFGLNQNNNPIEMFAEIHKKLRQIGNDQKEIGNARTMAATLGITDDMFAGLRIGTGNMTGFRRELMLTNREVQSMLEVNRAWKDFWATLKGSTNKAIADDLAKPMVAMTHSLKNAVLELGALAHALERFGTGAKVIGAGLVAVWAPWLAGVTAAAFLLDQIYKKTHGQKTIADDAEAKLSKTGGVSGTWDRIKNNKTDVAAVALQDTVGAFATLGKWLMDTISPKGAEQGAAPAAIVHVKQENHIHEANDATETARQLNEQISNAIFQNPTVNSLLKGGQ